MFKAAVSEAPHVFVGLGLNPTKNILQCLDKSVLSIIL